MWFFHWTKLNLKFCLISFARYREHFSFGCLQAILSLPAQIYAMSSTSEAKSRAERCKGGEEKVSEIQYWFAFETWNFSCYSNTRQRLKLIRLQGVSERLQDERNGKINRSTKSYKIPLNIELSRIPKYEEMQTKSLCIFHSALATNWKLFRNQF